MRAYEGDGAGLTRPALRRTRDDDLLRREAFNFHDEKEPGTSAENAVATRVPETLNN